MLCQSNNHSVNIQCWSDICQSKRLLLFLIFASILLTWTHRHIGCVKTLKVVFHDFPAPRSHSTTFHPWKFWNLNSMTFQHLYALRPYVLATCFKCVLLTAFAILFYIFKMLYCTDNITFIFLSDNTEPTKLTQFFVKSLLRNPILSN